MVRAAHGASWKVLSAMGDGVSRHAGAIDGNREKVRAV
jgi:hypothetical protein